MGFLLENLLWGKENWEKKDINYKDCLSKDVGPQFWCTSPASTHQQSRTHGSGLCPSPLLTPHISSRLDGKDISLTASHSTSWNTHTTFTLSHQAHSPHSQPPDGLNCLTSETQLPNVALKILLLWPCHICCYIPITVMSTQYLLKAFNPHNNPIKGYNIFLLYYMVGKLKHKKVSNLPNITQLVSGSNGSSACALEPLHWTLSCAFGHTTPSIGNSL